MHAISRFDRISNKNTVYVKNNPQSIYIVFSGQELNSRAQGEVSIREALRELELWGAGAVFSLTAYMDSSEKEISIIKDWKDLVNQVTCSTYVLVN